MPLATDVGLGPGNIVLDGDPALHHGHGQVSPTFAVYGCRQACVRINRGPCPLWPNVWMDQDTTWYGGRPRPSDIALDRDPDPPRKGGQQPNFRPMSILAKRLDGSG